MTNKKELNDRFIADINDHMEAIAFICYKKVMADRGRDYDNPDFNFVNFRITKRQVADSLDFLPTSIRSSMVARCQSFFNAVHEP